MASDASDCGGGAIFRDMAIFTPFTDEETKRHSEYREALLTLECFKKWAKPMSEGTGDWAKPSSKRPQRPTMVIVLTDNLGNVFSINKGRARTPAVTAIIAEIYEIAERHNIFFVAAWLPREANLGPDALSKCKTRAEALVVANQLP